MTEKFPNVFSGSFEEDKKLVGMYTNVESKKVRNRIAGYVASIVRGSQYEYVAPEEEELPEDYEEYELTREKEAKEEAEEEAVEEEPMEAKEEAVEEEPMEAAGEKGIMEGESVEKVAEKAVEEEEETEVEEETVKKKAAKKSKRGKTAKK